MVPAGRMENRSATGKRVACGCLLLVVALLASAQGSTARAQPAQAPTAKASSRPGQENLAEIGRKLTNPVSDVWALFTEFDLFFSDGDVNLGDDKVGGRMIFQPIMPFPLYGSGDKAWKLITRPNIPIVFSQPIPEGFNDFDHVGGLGDIQLLTHFAPPTGNWLIGAGPCWLFPTSTNDDLGRQQWGIGPSGVIGYKAKHWMSAIVPQYYFGIGSRRDRGDDVPDASYMNVLYFFLYELPNAWQIGTNPTLTYDHRATSGNKWNVPVGLTVAKTIRIGRVPVKFEFGAEYSVVSQDNFGQRFQLKLNIIPVIPSLVKKPILGR
jgi:hypothetical protein